MLVVQKYWALKQTGEVQATRKAISTSLIICVFFIFLSHLVISAGVVREMSHWSTSLYASQSGNSLCMPQTYRKCYYNQYTMKSVGTSTFTALFRMLKSGPRDLLCNAVVLTITVYSVIHWFMAVACKSNRNRHKGLLWYSCFEQRKILKWKPEILPHSDINQCGTNRPWC